MAKKRKGKRNTEFRKTLRRFKESQEEIRRLRPLLRQLRARRKKLLAHNARVVEDTSDHIPEGAYVHPLDKPSAWRLKPRRRP